MFDHIVFAADHHAVAAFQAPHTTAGADVHIVDPLGCELFCAANVIDVVGIPAVDEGVARLKMGQQVSNCLVNHCCWNHQP